MNQHCINKIGNELIPALKSFSNDYKIIYIGKDLHKQCYNHCVHNLPQHKHEDYIDICTNCVEYTHFYLDEALWNRRILQRYKLLGYSYYRGEDLLENLQIIREKYNNCKRFYNSTIEWKLHKIMELKIYLTEYNLLMNEHLIKLEDGIVVQLTDYEKEIQEFIEKEIEKEIENDILKIATELV
tara:strand:- start:6814 stop:7365 length:552 start_codon:yes stop_codon:yes gene_type:complete